MKSPSRRWSFPLAVMASLVVVVGCASMPKLAPPPPKYNPSPAKLAHDREQLHSALSPARRAELCFNNAQEFESQALPDEALAQYRRARELNPQQPGVAHRLAVLYDRQGDHEQATAEYALALAAVPRDADVWNDYGYFLYQRMKLTDAETALRRALEIAPQHRRATINLGLVLAEQGHYDAAFALHEKVVGPAAARSNLGVILARHGQHDAARQAFAEALKLDPSLEAPQLVQQASRTEPTVVADAGANDLRR